MISKIKKSVSILLSLIMVFSVFAIVPLSASAAYWYSDLARGTLIQPGDTFSFEEIGSFKFADYNDPTIIHEVKGSDFSYNQATLSVTDGYYSFGSTKLLPTSVSPGGLLVADYDSTTKMATFGVQNITHSFDETTGTLTIGGSGVVPPNYAFTGSDVYGVVFTQSNLVKHLIIDATDMIAIKQNAFMAYTGGCVLEDVVITSTSSAPLTIENNAIFYEKDSAVTITVNAATLPTVTSCPVDNYSSPVNLIYNVEQPITFNKNALTDPSGYLTVTFPTHCNIFIPAGPQFTDSQLQEEYDMFAEYGDEEFFWRDHSDLVEGTDYVLGDARYEELTPLNASLVVGNYNTALFSAYTITDASVNGAVTASVGGTDVTEAEPDSTVLLTVAPDSGYQFKSITAVGAKYGIEEFSDLVAVMGDAEFEAAEYADRPENTCKAEDGKFVVYNGTTPVTELSESDITDVSGLSGNSPMITCGNIRWYFGVSNGKITSIEAVNTSSWDYLFESANGSESTGTLPPADFALTTVTEGSQYSFTMPKRAVTVTAEFEEAPAPAIYTVTWKNWNGDVLETDEDVEEGTTPTYDGTTPTKEDDDNAYTFTGWTPAVEAVTADAIYTATFEPCVASVTLNGTTTKYTDFGTAVSDWTDGSTLKLLANVTTSSVIYFESGVKTLDLNGYGIKNTSANYEASNSVIYIRGSGTQLTLQDSRPNETTHYFTAPAGNAGLATDISDIDSGDQQSFHGGYLTGGNCFSGGGIRVDNGANLIMTGGTIIGNRGQYGGGIDVERNGSAGGSATISGGAIMYNYGTNYNGAIHTNTANYVSVSNCKITNNYAEHGAGAVYKSSVSDGFSGNMVVKDNKTGNNECNIVLGDNERISLSSALGDDAYIGITMSNPGVFTDSAETANNDASKFKSDDASYTVGKNADGQLYLYKSLIAGHSLSLDGNIGINFYLDPSVAGLTAQQVNGDNLSYTFAWADVETTKAKVNVAEQANQKNFSIETINGVDYIKVTCYVCAAEMTCDVIASFTLGDKTESKTYSVREYCDSVIKATPAQIDGLFGGTEKYNKLVGLVKAMLHYGAMAQTKFKVNTGYLANNKVDYNPGDVDGDMLDTAIAEANGTGIVADNMNNVAAALGAKWFSTSLIYLDDSTLRHYFVKDTNAFNPSAYTGNKSNYYYYVEVTGIPAAELDNLQTFKVGTESFKYSALDFVKGMITSSADGDSKNLAKSLYWYNQAANDYFPAPAPAEKILVLDNVTEDTTVEDGYTITGTLKGDYKISIADDATVTLRNVDITCLTNDNNAPFAGITPLGDATIMLEGANTVKGGYRIFPGIYVPADTTLTIDGTGSLTASSGGDEDRYGCGIGGGIGIEAGNIVINGGTVAATGGRYGAGIGSGNSSSCGNITITGGTVAATGGSYGAGIGSGYFATCGNIMIADTVTSVTATKGEDAPNSIGAGDEGSCGTVTIAPGANVTQN